RLAAWDHYDFEPGCAVKNAFQPAPRELADSEENLVARAGNCSPACATSATESFEKGLAFARAGRAADARAMLAQGDASGAGEFDVRARRPGPHAAPGPSAADARAALVRELGDAQ